MSNTGYSRSTKDEEKYRPLLNGIAESSPIVINGVEYTGSYLAVTVQIRDSIGEEARRTVQLIAELGRLVASAHRHMRLKEASYRAWRDGVVWRMTNSVEDAKAAGFDCAVNPGKDAKGKAKPAKTPAASAVEAYYRTLPDYLIHQLEAAEAEEAWATIHAVLEAAKQRTWALKAADEYEGGIGEDDNSRLSKATTTDAQQSEPIQQSRKRKGPPPPPKMKQKGVNHGA
jgi:hypothetical protein